MKNNQIHLIENFDTKELYSLSISINNYVPFSQKYLRKCFLGLIFKLKDIYALPPILTVNAFINIQC